MLVDPVKHLKNQRMSDDSMNVHRMLRTVAMLNSIYSNGKKYQPTLTIGIGQKICNHYLSQ